jgi:hypothetical protein
LTGTAISVWLAVVVVLALAILFVAWVDLWD